MTPSLRSQIDDRGAILKPLNPLADSKTHSHCPRSSPSESLTELRSYWEQNQFSSGVLLLDSKVSQIIVNFE